jgi:hypothetical protein
MWIERKETKSFRHNLETNHQIQQFIFENAIKIIKGEMPTFDFFHQCGANEGWLKQVKKVFSLAKCNNLNAELEQKTSFSICA